MLDSLLNSLSSSCGRVGREGPGSFSVRSGLAVKTKVPELRVIGWLGSHVLPKNQSAWPDRSQSLLPGAWGGRRVSTPLSNLDRVVLGRGGSRGKPGAEREETRPAEPLEGGSNSGLSSQVWWPPPPRRGVYVWGRAGVYKVLEQ